MRVAKYPLAAVVALILIAGPVCSRICDFNCSFYGCSLSSTAAASEQPGEGAACHQHKSHKKAPERKNSTECAGHLDATALLSASAHSSGAPTAPADALVPHLAPLPCLAPSSEQPVRQQGRKPDRSPPRPTVLRI